MALTPEEIAKYGQILGDGTTEKVSDFSAKVAARRQASDSYFGRVGEQYKAGGEQIVSDIEKYGGKTIESLKKGNIPGVMEGIGTGILRTGGTLARTAFAPITVPIERAIEKSERPFVGGVFAEKVIPKATELAQKYPEQARTAQDIFDIATLGLGGAAAKPVLRASQTGAKMAAEATAKTLKAQAMESIQKALGATTKPLKAKAERVATGILERPLSETFALTRKGLEEVAIKGKEMAGEALEAFGKLEGQTETAKIIDLLEQEKNQFVAGNRIVNEGGYSAVSKVQDILRNYGEVIDNETLREVRRIFDREVAASKRAFGITGAEKTVIDFKKIAANKIRGILADANPNLAKLNKEFNFWSDLEEVITATNERTAGQAGLTTQLATLAGAASGKTATDMAAKALTFRWLSEAVKSTGWRLVSAKTKNAIAEALAGKQFGAVVAMLDTIKGINTEAYQKLKDEWSAIKKEYENLPNKQGGFVRPFTGMADEGATTINKITPYKETGELSTKLLGKLEGRTTVSKQFISDLTNSPDLKQTERDIIREALKSEGDTINVPQFADKVKAELLPLEIASERTAGETARYESVTLPDELRGQVKEYNERIYASPIKTSAGDVHFSDDVGAENYFGHTRIEDMADNQTRRVIEVQSDLYQKGNLEREKLTGMPGYKYGTVPTAETIAEDTRILKSRGYTDEEIAKINQNSQNAIDYVAKREQEMSKLTQYNDPTAHFRMIREEVKKAAQDGKTKLQFPTGETAMKIEGLGGQNTLTTWITERPRRISSAVDDVRDFKLTPENMEVGKTVQMAGNTDKWIITDVLGDGKFKAVPKRTLERYVEGGKGATELDISPENLKEAAKYSEQFDISGKVDTSNPIYKFYEKEVGRYLKNKYNAELVTDEQGVKWWEVKIDKKWANIPVEAFGFAPLVIQDEK